MTVTIFSDWTDQSGRAAIDKKRRFGRRHEHPIARIGDAGCVRDRRFVVGGGLVAANRIRSERRCGGTGPSSYEVGASFLGACALDARSYDRAATNPRPATDGVDDRSAARPQRTARKLSGKSGECRFGASQAAPYPKSARQTRRRLDRWPGGEPGSRRYRADFSGGRGYRRHHAHRRLIAARSIYADRRIDSGRNGGRKDRLCRRPGASRRCHRAGYSHGNPDLFRAYRGISEHCPYRERRAEGRAQYRSHSNSN